MGPESGADFTNETFDYNGEGGGKCFKWYKKGNFQQKLRVLCGLPANIRLDTPKQVCDRCTERHIVAALRATSDELETYPQARSSLSAWVGPQCYPQVCDRARFGANARSREDHQSEEMASSHKLMQDCWLRCGEPGCRKWRLVAPECLPALTDMAPVERGRTCWRSWLDDAPLRYDVCLRAHRAHALATNPECDLLVQQAADDARSAQVAVEFAPGDVGMHEVHFVDDASVVRGAGDAASEGSTETVGSADLGSHEGSGDEWGAVLRSLGGAGGGLAAADLAEQRKAEATELGSCSYAAGSAKSSRVLFRCDMVMCKREVEEDGDGLWRFMTCDDPCDFISIRDADWGRSDVWLRDDPIVLWPSDARCPPCAATEPAQRLQRFGVVLKGVVAGADTDVLETVHHSRASATRSGDRAATDSKVIVRVDADVTAGLEKINEVHYSFNKDTQYLDAVSRPTLLYQSATRSRVHIDREYVNRGKLPARVALVPVKLLQPRVAKYNVVLKEGPLRAVHAKQTMMTRMVLFTCNECAERFPAFHPAYDPRDVPKLDVELLRRGKDGVAACNTEVAKWDEFPPLEQSC